MTLDSLRLGFEPALRMSPRTTLKPYKAIDGIPTFRDSEVVHLFAKAKEERLLPLVMYSVDPETPIPAFARMFRIGGGNPLWLVFYDDKLAGWVWLNDFKNRTALTHFCLFRWVSRAKLSEEIGRDMFSELFNLTFNPKSRNEMTLQVIRAEMPAFNKPGRWFLEKIGLKAIGEIPNAAFRFSTGKFCPMVYLYATRDMLQRSAPSMDSTVPLRGEG